MKFKVSNKSWILLSTAIVIGIVFSIYFLVYVKGKEKAIISNNFRVLQQVVYNIKSLENSYLNNARIKKKNTAKSLEVNRNLLAVTQQQIFENENAFKTLNTDIFYGNEGIFFRVDDELSCNTCNYYFTSYDVFFDNELFQRKDVFDQIMITEVKKENEFLTRNVLYSNRSEMCCW